MLILLIGSPIDDRKAIKHIRVRLVLQGAPQRMSVHTPFLPQSQYWKEHQLVPLGLAAGGVVSLGIASVGFAWWYGADYFHHQGAYDRNWVGYDVFTFVGLLLFTVCSSSGVTLLYV
ncbi:ferric reductase, partial [Trypanosoma rangeli]